MMAVFKVLSAIALVWLVYFLRGNVYFRLYPAIVTGVAFFIFFISSFKTPIVEKIAKKRGEILDEKGLQYCRKVNRVWVVFLFLHFLVTLATVIAPLEIWAIYNGAIAYILFAMMFAGEWLCRCKVKGVKPWAK